MPSVPPKPVQPFDLLIIGAGPTALYAAFCAGFRELSVALVDSFPFIGGQLAAYYPEKRILDIPAIPAISATELIDQLLLQARRFNPTIVLGHRVERFHRPAREEFFNIETSPGWKPIIPSNEMPAAAPMQPLLRARAILVTAGVGALTPRPTKLAIPAGWVGTFVHDHVGHSSQFAQHRVTVSGGTLPAVRWAIEMAVAGAAVTLVHRGAHLHAPAEMLEKLRDRGVVVMMGYEISGLIGQEKLDGVTVVPSLGVPPSGGDAEAEAGRLKAELRTAGPRTIPADHLILAGGYNSSLAPLKQWGLALDGTAIRVDGGMRTSRPGVWAAGDIVAYDGKVKLLATNFAEAAMAVNHIKVHLDPNARLFPGHSSEDERFALP